MKSKAICPNAVDLPLNWFVNLTDEFCQTEKLGNIYIEFPVAVKTTPSFGSDARLKMSESLGEILRVTLLKEIEDSRIFVMAVNEPGFHSPIISPVSPRMPEIK